MFIQATGRNQDGKKVSFIATNPGELLKWMQKHGIQESTVYPEPLDSDVIVIRHLSQADVERWVKNGEI